MPRKLGSMVSSLAMHGSHSIFSCSYIRSIFTLSIFGATAFAIIFKPYLVSHDSLGYVHISAISTYTWQ